MNTSQIVSNFLSSEFAVNNLFAHMQIGLPLPFLYKDGLGIRFFFHKMTADAERIGLEPPSFEVWIAYPSCRVIRFAETDRNAYRRDGISVSQNKVRAFKKVYERCFAACDEVISFADQHSKITPVVLKEYYRCVAKNAPDIGMEKWYGGNYDNNSGI